MIKGILVFLLCAVKGWLTFVLFRMADCDVKQKEARAEYQGMRWVQNGIQAQKLFSLSDSIPTTATVPMNTCLRQTS